MSASDYGFKISLPGYDVKTATPEQCVIHSSYPPLKSLANQSPPLYATLNVDFTATVVQGVAHTLYAINHPYGYIPFTLSNIVFTSASTGATPIIGIGEAGVGATLVIQAYSTTSQFIVTIADDFNWTDSTALLRVSYYIFAENGT